MNNNSNNMIDYCRNIMINHTIILIILLFVIVYIIINYNTIIKGNILNGNFSNSIIITGIIFLITYFFILWDEESNDINKYSEKITTDIKIPKYKISNKTLFTLIFK